MTLVFSLLTVQSLLGLVDSLWNHEIGQRLALRRAARVELALHATRAFAYTFVFLALAWREWHGAWAVLIAAVLLLDAAVTAADFVVEDRTRRLTAFERVLHTVLTLLFGVFLMALAPLLLDWLAQPTALVGADHGGFSVLFSVLAAGMAAWGLRDAFASLMHFRPAEWVREPIAGAEAPSGRSVLVSGATGTRSFSGSNGMFFTRNGLIATLPTWICPRV